MKITFLGTGTSIYIELENLNILIDTPPELRLQLLDNNITKVNAILFTHPHADHIMGFDDIRALNRTNHGEIPCYGNNFYIKNVKITPLKVKHGKMDVFAYKIKNYLIMCNLLMMV